MSRPQNNSHLRWFLCVTFLGLLTVPKLNAQQCCASQPPPPTCPLDSGDTYYVLEWVPTPSCYWKCQRVSPIILDLEGSGFQLTDATNGVWFDFFGTGSDIHISWTAKGSENAFLALDRNGNGVIDSALELFGNITPQPASSEPNGFAALALFDDPKNGGNSDGLIEQGDKIFSKLLLWQDSNHDGISQPEELHHLAEMGILAIHLSYHPISKIDSYGNRFRYSARVETTDPEIDKTAYDVFLVPDGNTTISASSDAAGIGSGSKK